MKKTLSVITVWEVSFEEKYLTSGQKTSWNINEKQCIQTYLKEHGMLDRLIIVSKNKRDKFSTLDKSYKSYKYIKTFKNNAKMEKK